MKVREERYLEFHLTGTCHFARKIHINNSVNSEAFQDHNSADRIKTFEMK